MITFILKVILIMIDLLLIVGVKYFYIISAYQLSSYFICVVCFHIFRELHTYLVILMLSFFSSMRGDEAKEACPQIQLVQVPVARGKADLNSYRNAGSEVYQTI